MKHPNTFTASFLCFHFSKRRVVSYIQHTTAIWPRQNKDSETCRYSTYAYIAHFMEKEIQGAYKLSEDFAKPYFYKYWTEIHDVTAIWKRNVCSFIVTLNAFDVRPKCDTADVQAILPIPAKPSQACFVWRSRLRCWCALAIMVVSLEVVGCKHCPWRNPTGKNHTLCKILR